MSISLRRVLDSTVFCTWLLFPLGAAGQEEPMEADCESAIAALSEGDRDSANWDILPECGPAGAQAVAVALTSARTESGGLYLQTLVNLAQSVQDPSILEAAHTLARDRTATVASRVGALLTLLGQYDAALSFPISHSWDELVSTPLRECKLSPISGANYAAQRSMPADYVQRIAAVVDEVGDDPEEDPVVRKMAECMSLYIPLGSK